MDEHGGDGVAAGGAGGLVPGQYLLADLDIADRLRAILGGYGCVGAEAVIAGSSGAADVIAVAPGISDIVGATPGAVPAPPGSV